MSVLDKLIALFYGKRCKDTEPLLAATDALRKERIRTLRAAAEVEREVARRVRDGDLAAAARIKEQWRQAMAERDTAPDWLARSIEDSRKLYEARNGHREDTDS